MLTHRHKIEKVEFDIAFGSEAVAFDQQAHIDRMVKKLMLPVVAEVLDEYSAEGVVIRLDQLEVDLGAIELADYPDELAPRLRKQLREALAKKVSRLKDCPDSGDSMVSEPGAEVELLGFFSEIRTLSMARQGCGDNPR